MQKKSVQKNLADTHSCEDYWQNLVSNYSSSAKLWLENFEIATGPEHDVSQSFYCTESISLEKELLNSIRKYSKKEKIDLAAIFHSAWGLLLNRFCGTDDIIYGSFYNDSTKANPKSNSITPVRSTILDNQTLSSYIKATHDTLIQNKKYLKHYLSSTEITPEIKNIFHYIILINSTVSSEGYPLSLVIKEKPSFKISLQYDQTKFAQKSIQNIIQHFVIILNQLSKNTDQLTAHFSILSNDENNKLLHDWNSPKLSHHNAHYVNKCISHLFTEQAHKAPNAPCVVYNNLTLSYREIDEISNKIAQFLLQKKVHPGDMIAVLMERTPAIIATMLAIFKVGATYVPINPKYPDEKIEFILTDCNTHLILVNNTKRIPKDFLYKTSIIEEDFSSINTLPNKPAEISLSSDQIAYVIYTSGTTGQPKGVLINHEALVNLTEWYQVCFSIQASDRASQFASQGFDTFFCETIPFLSVGASIHIIDDNMKLTPSIFLPWLAQQKITICDLPTAYAQILFNLTWPDHLSLKTVKIGGENLAHYPTHVFPFDIWNIYGPTETTIEATFIKIYQANSQPNNQSHRLTHPPIGKPIPNSEMYVVDSHMELVSINNVGELLIGGKIISPGYLNRPQLTREKFIRNIFSSDPNSKLYRTGDLVRWLDDGNLEYIGRIDHQVKIRGYRIELSEIETSLRNHPDISEVVVLAKELVNSQKSLIAYLVPNLDKIRIPYQERCMISISEMKFIQVLTEDISKEGAAITGITEKFELGQQVRLNLKLPGTSENQWLNGVIIWQLDQRAGIQFIPTQQQKLLLQKSIEYYLATHNLMETLQSAAAKRNIRKALNKKLPEYMVPTIFSIMPNFPLTFNGKIDWKSLPPPQDFERLLERSYAAPRNKTEEELVAIWCDILSQNKVSITDNFFDLGGNSLLVSQLSVRILKQFNISIPAKILFDLPFIPVIAEYIDSNGEKYTTTTSVQNEIQRDAILNDDILPNKKLSPHLNSPKEILLTGAAGFLGIFLLRELLATTESKIYCLVRKGEFESVAKRLSANIDKFALNNEISLANRRIIIIPSDLGSDQFGIPLEQYNNLAEKIDLIYHCGAQVNTMASYMNLRNSNVQGTIEIIKFATYKIGKPIHYISTLSSACKIDEKNNFVEEFPDADSSKLIGGYALSKWVSERLLTQIKNRGLPISIYRSGYILGQLSTGITNVNDALLLLIKGCIQLEYAPNWKEKITVLPVDFISQAIVGISLYHPEKSGVFHIDHPKGIMWTDLIAWLNNYGYKIKLCSHQDWIKRLSKVEQDNALYPFLPNYLSQTSEPQTPGTDVTHATAILKELHLLPYPPIDDQFLSTYFNYLWQAGFFPTPQNKKKQASRASS